MGGFDTFCTHMLDVLKRMITPYSDAEYPAGSCQLGVDRCASHGMCPKAPRFFGDRDCLTITFDDSIGALYRVPTRIHDSASDEAQMVTGTLVYGVGFWR